MNVDEAFILGKQLERLKEVQETADIICSMVPSNASPLDGDTVDPKLLFRGMKKLES